MDTWAMFAGILGAIVLIGNAGAMIHRWIQPAINQKETVDEHDRAIKALQSHEAADLERLEHLQEMNKLQLKSMICLLNHMIDGNGVERMKETRDDIQDMFTKL